ncbi:DUF2207 domain-containing protein [Amycolatopsis sp. NPDC021455]|uniref:DUF2207 family protein n=1 Tax=Amycolatopsis sp. NPDC021455 TaxID=3154901 RepID=UPI0033E1C1FF
MALFLGVPRSAHAGVDDFTIESFSADYHLGVDQDRHSRLDVTERLTMLFPAIDQNHGFERILPGDYDGHPVGLRMDAVTDGAGRTVPWTTRSVGADTVVRIGDPSRFVHGSQVYELHYLLRDVTRSTGDHDELHWNTSGTHWRQLVEKTVVRLYLDAGVMAAYNGDHACLQGTPESAEPCAVARTIRDGATTFTLTASRPMRPGENVSLRFGFRLGTFATSGEPGLGTGTIVGWGALNVVAVLAGTAFLVRLWRRRVTGFAAVRDREPVTVPPGNVSVPMAAVLCGRPHLAFGAGLLDLAVRGYLTITRSGRGDKVDRRKIYRLRFTRDLAGLTPPESHVARIVFGEKPRRGSKTDTGRFPARVPPRAKVLVERLEAEALRLQLVRKEAVHRKPYYWWGGALIVLGTALVSPGVVAVGIATCVVASRFSRLTDAGAELRNQLLCLRKHLKETWRAGPREPDPAELLDPARRLLPYAVVFGLDRSWNAVLNPKAPRTTSPDGPDPWWPAIGAGPATTTFSGSAGGGGGGDGW